MKVYDAVKGFQTHNFVGHHNIVLTLMFIPAKDSLRLVTAGEDLVIKIWDLVINKEVFSLKGAQARITSIVFSRDNKTMIVGDKDGKVAFYSVADGFRQIAIMDACKDMGVPGEAIEINTMCFVTVAKHQYLMLGTNSGQIAVVDLHTQKVCYLED